MTSKDELHRLVDRLPEDKVRDALLVLEEILDQRTKESLTPEELADADQGRDEIRRGDYITREEYRRNRGL